MTDRRASSAWPSSTRPPRRRQNDRRTSYVDVRVERRDGRIAFVKWCPRCGPHASVAVAVHLDCGRWFDEARGCRGDLAELVRGYADVPAGDEILVEVVDAVRASAAQRAGADVAS